MRVGVDITPLQAFAPGGIGTSTYSTLKALAELEGVDLCLFGTRPPVIPFTDIKLDLPLPLKLGHGLLARSNIAWIQYGMRELLERNRIDVFWGTRHVLPRNAPGVARVATAYDFWYETHPEQQPFVNRTLNRYVTSSFMSDADVVTAISDAIADQARRLFPGAADRVRTVLLGVDGRQFAKRTPDEVERVRGRLGLQGDYVLALDVYNPRKNVAAILDALAGLAAGSRSLELVAVGSPRKTATEIDVAAKATALGIGNRVRFAGDVGQDELAVLYSGALALVYPSFYEGFGMPVLEAMTAGTPVICSNTSSLPQVAGDAALLVSPSGADEIARAVEQLLSDDPLRARMIEAGLARAHELTWEATARGMLHAFEDATDIHRQRKAS